MSLDFIYIFLPWLTLLSFVVGMDLLRSALSSRKRKGKEIGSIAVKKPSLSAQEKNVVSNPGSKTSKPQQNAPEQRSKVSEPPIKSSEPKGKAPGTKGKASEKKSSGSNPSKERANVPTLSSPPANGMPSNKLPLSESMPRGHGTLERPMRRVLRYENTFPLRFPNMGPPVARHDGDDKWIHRAKKFDPEPGLFHTDSVNMPGVAHRLIYTSILPRDENEFFGNLDTRSDRGLADIVRVILLFLLLLHIYF